MPTPFKDLEFSFKQVRILRKLRDDGCISKELVRSNPEYSFLQKYTTLLIMIPNAMTFTVRVIKL